MYYFIHINVYQQNGCYLCTFDKVDLSGLSYQTLESDYGVTAPRNRPEDQVLGAVRQGRSKN